MTFRVYNFAKLKVINIPFLNSPMSELIIYPLVLHMKKGYGANHTLLWRTGETLSVKLPFQWWLRQPKNTC